MFRSHSDHLQGAHIFLIKVTEITRAFNSGLCSRYAMSERSFFDDKNRKKICGHKKIIKNYLEFFVP